MTTRLATIIIHMYAHVHVHCMLKVKAQIPSATTNKNKIILKCRQSSITMQRLQYIIIVLMPIEISCPLYNSIITSHSVKELILYEYVFNKCLILNLNNHFCYNNVHLVCKWSMCMYGWYIYAFVHLLKMSIYFFELSREARTSDIACIYQYIQYNKEMNEKTEKDKEQSSDYEIMWMALLC